MILKKKISLLIYQESIIREYKREYIREYFSIKSSNLKYTHGKVSLKLGRKICVDLNNLSKNVKQILFAFVNLTI